MRIQEPAPAVRFDGQTAVFAAGEKEVISSRVEVQHESAPEENPVEVKGWDSV